MPKNRCIHEVCYIVDVDVPPVVQSMHLNVAKQALETFFPVTSASVRNWYFIWVSFGRSFILDAWLLPSFSLYVLKKKKLLRLQHMYINGPYPYIRLPSWYSYFKWAFIYQKTRNCNFFL